MEGCMPRGYIATAPSSNPAAQVIAVTSLSWVCCSLEYRGSLSVLKQVDEDGSRAASPPSRCSRNRCCAPLHPCSWENPAAGARLDPCRIAGWVRVLGVELGPEASSCRDETVPMHR